MSLFIHYIIPFLYFLLCCYFLSKKNKKGDAFLSTNFIIIFFIIKCLAGFLYNWVSFHYFPEHGDIWEGFSHSLKMNKAFSQSPGYFLKDYYSFITSNNASMFDADKGFAQNSYIIIDVFQFALNFLSCRNLYTNTIIFNFIGILAALRLWKFLRQFYGNNFLFATVALFFFPSLLFYSSGIFKEGFIFIMICWLIPLVYNLIFEKFTFKRFAAFILAFFLLFTLKFLVGITFLGAMFLWWLFAKYPQRQIWIASSFIIIAVILFFSTATIFPQLNLPQSIVNRQQEFFLLKANSQMAIDTLQPTVKSFIHATPRAAYNVLLKPIPGEGGKILYMVYSVEILLFWLVIIALLMQSRFKLSISKTSFSLGLALLIFAIANLLLIGFIVPNIGAIVRYRSIFLPFIAFFFIISFSNSPLLMRINNWLRAKIE